MARMSLDTAIRLSAQVTGGGNITKVQRSLQDLAKGSQVTAREMQTLRSATFQYARANDGTIAGIRNSITAFRGLQEQAKIGSREFKRYGTEIQQLEAKLKGIDGTAQKAGRSMGQNLAAGLAAAGIGQALRGITAQAGKFDAEVRKAAAIEGGAGSFSVLQKEIEKVAAAAAGTPTEVAELATSLSRAGFSAKETTESLAGIVRGAEATSVTFAEMGSIAADNLRAFGLQTNETERVVDVLTQTANKSNQTVLDLGESMKYAAPIARSLGVPLEDLAAVMALLANNGIRGSDAGTALRTGLTRLQIAAGGADSEIADLTRGNIQLTKAMATLGSEILDAEGKLRPLDQVLNGLKKSLSGLSATDQAILAKALFGTEAGSKFQALLNSTTGQVDQMFAAIRNSGGVAEKTQKQMQGFQYSVIVLGGNFEYLTNQVGGAIGFAFKPLVDFLNRAIGVAQKFPEPVKAIGSAAAAAALLTLGLVTAVVALKAGLAALGGAAAIKAAIAGVLSFGGAAGTAGTASAVAAVKVKALGGALATIGKIGLITVGVNLAIYGLEELQRTQSLLDQLRGKTPGGIPESGTFPGETREGLVRRQQQQRAQVAELEQKIRDQRAIAAAMPAGTGVLARRELEILERRLAAARRTIAADPGSLPSAAEMARRAPAGNALGTPIGATVGGGGAAAGASESKKQAESIGAQIAKALQQALDLTPAQSAGVVGNLMRESGLNPRINEGGAVGAPRGVGGYGLAQWTGTRQQDLIRFAGGAAAAGNLQTQLRFMVSELMGPESKALASLRRAATPEEAAVVFDRDYERSGIKALPERQANARRIFSEISGTGPGAGLDDFADQLKLQAEAAEKLREQKEAADELLTTERNRLAVLQESDPMQKKIIESMIEELEIEKKFQDLIKESPEQKQTLELAKQNAIKSNTLELERELSDLARDAQKPLQDALTEAGNRLAYEREYGQLLAQGINPELAKQFVELDRIASAAKENLDLQIAMLEARAAELPIASETRKELERQIQLRKEQLNLIPGTVAQTRNNIIAAGERTPAEDVTARIGVIKGEIKDLTDIGQVAITSADNIGSAFGTAFSGLISGASSAREALAGFFRDLAANFLEMASQIIAKQITLIVLQNILKSLGVDSGGGIGGGLGFGGASDPLGAGGAFWNANGNAFAGGGIAPFANGGTFTNNIVSSPTLFKFATGGTMQAGVMGEAGPEAIMPLRRGPGGRLGVDASGGGGGGGNTVNQVTVNVDAKGSNVAGDDNTSRKLGTVVADAVQAELVKQQRPGGLLDRNRTKSG